MFLNDFFLFPHMIFHIIIGLEGQFKWH